MGSEMCIRDRFATSGETINTVCIMHDTNIGPTNTADQFKAVHSKTWMELLLGTRLTSRFDTSFSLKTTGNDVGTVPPRNNIEEHFLQEYWDEDARSQNLVCSPL